MAGSAHTTSCHKAVFGGNFLHDERQVTVRNLNSRFRSGPMRSVDPEGDSAHLQLNNYPDLARFSLALSRNSHYAVTQFPPKRHAIPTIDGEKYLS